MLMFVPLNTASKLEIARIKTVLDSMDRGRLVGCIVKIPTEVLLDDEHVADHLTQKYVFGAVYNVADVCEHTGSRALEVNWSIDHRFFRLARNDFGGMVPIWEHEMMVVKKGDDLEDDGGEKMVTGYFINTDGNWKCTDKRVSLCDNCKKNTCDRMTYSTEWEREIGRLRSVDGSAKSKRYLMYGYYITLKHRYLGVGNRRRVQSCVQRLVLDSFPVTTGTTRVGFIRENVEE